MIINKFPYHIILASNSPRRHELLDGLKLPYETRVLPNINEDYPSDIPTDKVAEYIAREKADAYRTVLAENELVLTADTIVIAAGKILGKPHDTTEAREMLHLLSGRTHQVTTGVCLLSHTFERSFSVVTDVTFKVLSDEEIDFYVDTFKPLDKAGAYGIQEWIGYIGVTELRGSYFNVMGLPVQRIWETLKDIQEQNTEAS